jgi:hypothetical protein
MNELTSFCQTMSESYICMEYTCSEILYKFLLHVHKNSGSKLKGNDNMMCHSMMPWMQLERLDDRVNNVSNSQL